MNKKYDLKIETGIGGGSLSLWSEDGLIDFFLGDEKAKKNDFLIENISSLLKRNSVEKFDIKKIIYSNYPGSQTGLKILHSILKGFSSVFEVEIEAKNLFDSISEYFFKTIQKKQLIILNKSSTAAEFVLFDSPNNRILNDEVNFGAEEKILKQIINSGDIGIYIDADSLNRLSAEFLTSIHKFSFSITELENNLSKYL